MKVVSIDLSKIDEYYRRISKFAKELKKRGAKEVYLFGSFARGEVTEASDIDLLVIWNLDKRFHERAIEVMKLTDLPVQPIVLTEKEFEKMRNRRFYKEVLKYAKKLV